MQIDLTSTGHLIIIGGIIMAYIKSKNVENLIETQHQTIEALKEGFEACKDNLELLEKKVNNIKE